MPRRIAAILQQLEESRKEISGNLSVVVDNELPAEVKERVRSLLANLARDDFSMALLDLAQLSRTMTGNGEAVTSGNRSCAPVGSSAAIRALVYGEDGITVTQQCEGPTKSTACPRVALGCPVACAGRWVLAGGWRYRVAPEATFCPVAQLGIVRIQPTANALGPLACAPATSPNDVFVCGPGEAAHDWSGDAVEEGFRLSA